MCSVQINPKIEKKPHRFVEKEEENKNQKCCTIQFRIDGNKTLD